MDDGPVLDEWAQRVYLTWLARDLRYALVSLEEIRTRAGQPPDPLVWVPIETFLMFTAKASKMLKPPLADRPPRDPAKREAYDRRKHRGEQLRTVLQVEDGSAVLDRTVRDASEHFDERLDDWIARQRRPTAEELEAGTVPSFPPPPLRKAPDHDSWVVEVAGSAIDLGPVEAELRRILDRILQLEPLTVTADSHLATLLASLPPFPTELRLNAPTRRPDEHVLTGVDPAMVANIDTQIGAAITRLAAAFNTAGSADPDDVTLPSTPVVP